jgi:hypothetical protein
MNGPQDNDFPPDYSERIARVCQHCADGLSGIHGDLLAQLRVVCRYFQEGQDADISHEELIDFLGISTPSVLDNAGYSDPEALEVMKALPLITHDKHGNPQPPAALPPPPPEPPKAEQAQLDL